jgi:ribosomal protein L11 methylase PrmA
MTDDTSPTEGRGHRVQFDQGSFRDPAGRVARHGERVLRFVYAGAAADYTWLRDNGILERLIAQGRVVPTREVQTDDLGPAAEGAVHVLEHDVIPFWSYPYEWPFAALKRAALFHLDLHADVLARDATLVDASAYNVQFIGAQPLFIDVLSLRRYHDGELWDGHRQFCEQFLNPLLLQASRGVAFNTWYRGSMEGIPVTDLSSVLGAGGWLSWQTLMHVKAQARMQLAAETGRISVARARERRLSKTGLLAMLTSLRRWIARLEPRSSGSIGWTTYAETNTYGSEEAAAKRQFVAEFAARVKPALLADVGCNTGDYSVCALEAGARAVIGLEGDPATADRAFRRAEQAGLNFLPLVMDAADPSPARGWRGRERRSLHDRSRFDAVIALAFEHHLAIGRNVPLDDVVAWLIELAPAGVIEFVPKDDPTVQRMLALRKDIFDTYDRTAFVNALSARGRIVRNSVVSATGRELFWYER